MDFSAKLLLPYLLPNQAKKHVILNESLRALDAIVPLSARSISETGPPQTPEEGQRYIPAVDSAEAWAGTANRLACFQDGAWRFFEPQTGWLA